MENDITKQHLEQLINIIEEDWLRASNLGLGDTYILRNVALLKWINKVKEVEYGK